jgi:type III secretory pathway lipoprotein EscJ
MAAPNIVNVTTITGKTAVTNLTSTNATLVVENPASSNKVFKINSLIVSNVDGVNPANITVSLYSEDNIGGTATQIANTIAVPADATVIIIDKNSSIYLEEDKSIGATASAANDLKVVCSYEEIS